MPTNRTLVKQQVATYTACLLEAAKSANRVFDDIDNVKKVRSAVLKSVQVREFLEDTGVPAENKKAFIKDAFKDFSPEVVSVVSVMAERGDLKLLGRVASNYELEAEKALDTVVVDVTTAVELDDHLRDVICNKLQADLGHTVRLNETVDKSILGGIIMSVHGKRMDASVKTQLAHARQVLSTASTGGDK